MDSPADKSQEFTLVHLNVQGFSGKEGYLELLTEETNPRVLGLTETWWKDDISACGSLQNYELVDSYCRRNHIRGGVAIFVRRDTAPRANPINFDRNLISELDFEVAAIELDKTVCILSIYRSPAGEFNIFINRLTSLLNTICQKYSNIIICGDLNVDKLKKRDRENLVLHDLFGSYQLVSLIDRPTRICGHSKTAIDYLVTNLGDVTGWDIIHFPASDHTAQSLEWKYGITADVDQFRFKRMLGPDNIKEFKYLFGSSRLDLDVEDNIDVAFDKFFGHFIYCYNTACPSLRFKNRNKPGKMHFTYSRELKAHYDNVKFLGYVNNTINDDHFRTMFDFFRRQLSARIQHEKVEFYNRVIQSAENKSKKLWEVVRLKTGREKAKKGISLQMDDELVTSKEIVADRFGKHFSCAVKDKLGLIYGSGNNRACTTVSMSSRSMFFGPVTSSEIMHAISALKNNTAPGIDEVATGVLKVCSAEVADYLSVLLNKAVTAGQYPSRLKVSLVIPLFKKGDACNIENYRQVALVSAFSKVFEKVVYGKIMQFLNRFNLISPCQHGFRAGYSTETATVDFVQYIMDGIDRRKHVAGLFFDLSQAFDTIDLSHLSHKLYYLGIRGPLNRFLVSFASERQIIVKNAGVFSKRYDVDVGTPQGSVLGPLLFLLYVNDLPDFISGAKVYMYADDTSLVVTADDQAELERNVADVVHQFADWCGRNRLIVNRSKTVAVKFDGLYMAPLNDLRLTVNNVNIPIVSHVNFLGTVVDTRVDWNEHISKVCARLGKAYYAILTVKNNLGMEALTQIYYALVQSVLSYNIVVWGQAVELHRVFVLQKRIIRMMFGIPPRHTCRDFFKNNGFLTVTSVYLLKLLTYIHTNKDKFTIKRDVHGHNTRGEGSFHLDKIYHLNHRKSPHYAGCSIFNRLPKEWRDLSPAKFKTSIKQLLKEEVFYSLEEFYTYLTSIQRRDI